VGGGVCRFSDLLTSIRFSIHRRHGDKYISRRKQSVAILKGEMIPSPIQAQSSTGGYLLTAAEVRELTGRIRRSAQVVALRFMGIEHRVRPDGTVAVLRSHVEQLFGSRELSLASRRTSPDFSLVS
jgi:Domain of unknown function (DUF4224)